MGEKIRDIKEITVVNTKYMVELNKGYSKKEGDLIHIQNNSYRLCLQVPEFLKLCGSVFRAKSELDYLKGINEKEGK